MGEYNSLHPLYSISKITSNLEFADNLVALEQETNTEIEIDQSTGTQGYATLLIRSDNEKLVGVFSMIIIVVCMEGRDVTWRRITRLCDCIVFIVF